MKKSIFLFISLFGLFGQIYAQQNVLQGDLSINSSGAEADTSAILDVQSTTRGVVLPRMTTTQRIAIASPTRGLLVYDTDLDQFCYFDTTSWNCLPTFGGPGGGSGTDSCITLDEAYDCGGDGAGRTIDVDAGSVQLIGSIDFPFSTLEAVNIGTGYVAEFWDLTPLLDTESKVTIGWDGDDAVRSRVHIPNGRAGVFEIADNTSVADALEGYNTGTRHGVFGHTDFKVPVIGAFSIAAQPPSGVMGISSNDELRKGSSGVSVKSDGIWGKSFANASGYDLVNDPTGIIAGVHGTMLSAQTVTGNKDYFGVIGITQKDGNGVLGIGGGKNFNKGHGVVGVSAYEQGAGTNAGVWGVTREGQAWEDFRTTFPLEEITPDNKLQVGVLGQSKEFVAVWGESLEKIGVIGTTNVRRGFGSLGDLIAGVFGYNHGLGYGVVGQGHSDSLTHAGVKASGCYNRDRAAALEIHDGAIRVSKDNATHTPADVIEVTVSNWTTIQTCDAGTPLHNHLQAFTSNPIPITNQYVDADRSIILVSIMVETPGVSIQLIEQYDGGFSVMLTVHSKNMPACIANPAPDAGYRVHYMIVNK